MVALEERLSPDKILQINPLLWARNIHSQDFMEILLVVLKILYLILHQCGHHLLLLSLERLKSTI